MQNPSKSEIKEILDRSKRIAVVGLSDRPDRTSYILNTFTISIGPSTSFNEATALTPSASSIVGLTGINQKEMVKMQNPSKSEIKEILDRSKRIAVVGLSDRVLPRLLMKRRL
jgi:hypothetical protein